jgi:hypothetical protein
VAALGDVLVTVRAFSFGGGVQSTAALVLAARGEIDFRLFLFSNVGEDSESPETLDYVRAEAIPYAAAHDVELVELFPTRFRRPETLLALLTDESRESISIPVRGGHGGPVVRRSCTRDFKIRVVDRELARRGATRQSPATIALGISLDEISRATTRPSDSGLSGPPVYPLLDLRLTRDDCRRIIADAGLRLPPKSACWFCPYTKLREWKTMRDDHPERFAAAVAIERRLGDRSVAKGHERVYLSRYGGPLDQVVPDQLTLDAALEDDCESGYCMT